MPRLRAPQEASGTWGPDHRTGSLALPQHISLAGGRTAFNIARRAALREIHWPRLRLLLLAVRPQSEGAGDEVPECGSPQDRGEVSCLSILGADLVHHIGSLLIQPVRYGPTA